VLNSIIGFGLLQCPADLLRVVLSVYMYQEGANIRLPETDEVLMCNSSTTAEDVSSFLNFLLFICLYPSCRWDQRHYVCGISMRLYRILMFIPIKDYTVAEN